MKVKVIITGSTGMVGEGVMHECLMSPDVESVLIINRKPGNHVHSKLKEIIHPDFSDFKAIQEQLIGYNACFFCMGVSSVGMKEPEYTRITYDITLAFAKILVKNNPGMVFNYVSGTGTDSSEKGRSMWARVKGKTENDLQKFSFRDAYMFRPGYIHPTKGLKNTYRIYKILGVLYPLWKLIFPKNVCKLQDIGLAMINSVTKGYEKKILEAPDIIKLAQS
jgi:hypothetical protein